MSKEIVSFPITSEKADELMAFYLDYQKLNNGEYIVFQADYSGVIITIYRDKKNKHKVVFSGEGALTEAKKWNIEAEAKEAKAALNGGWLCKDNQIGSDEVGVGDFLLPVTVVAAFVRGRDLKTLEDFTSIFGEGTIEKKNNTNNYYLIYTDNNLTLKLYITENDKLERIDLEKK